MSQKKVCSACSAVSPTSLEMSRFAAQPPAHLLQSVSASRPRANLALEEQIERQGLIWGGLAWHRQLHKSKQNRSVLRASLILCALIMQEPTRSPFVHSETGDCTHTCTRAPCVAPRLACVPLRLLRTRCHRVRFACSRLHSVMHICCAVGGGRVHLRSTFMCWNSCVCDRWLYRVR